MASEQQKQMARRVAEKVARRLHVSNDQQRCDDLTSAALAAIMETQAQHVEWLRTEATSPKALRVKGTAAITALADAANALERGEHYALAGER